MFRQHSVVQGDVGAPERVHKGHGDRLLHGRSGGVGGTVEAEATAVGADGGGGIGGYELLEGAGGGAGSQV
jgi:hypothetical protein